VQSKPKDSNISLIKKPVGSNLCETILLAAHLLDQVRHGTSLTQALASVPNENRSAAQSLTFEALRNKPKILQALKEFLRKDIDPEVEDLFLIAISTLLKETQNQYTAYTLVNETVNAAQKSLKTRHAKGLINAVLRRVIENPQSLEIDVLNAQYPSWWVKHLKRAYPSNLGPILEANLKPSKMFLRVNSKKISKEGYLSLLKDADIAILEIPQEWQKVAPNAIALQNSMPVQLLPGFKEGLLSVQDLGAQIAGHLISPVNDEYILDACSAPGGKASQILELANVNLDVLDIDEERMQRVQENLLRLDLQANLHIGDAANSSPWWSGKYYDAILADVPCSATGIIRRHPDILYLRRSTDITQLQDLQRKIMMELWGLLKPGGRLLFVTCSIFPQEGELQLEWFTENLKDALRLECLGQILPDEWHDGFYYGMLQKKR
jgi:16S rRNA (cytosine967-C5)-methyltransferase